MVRVKLGIFLVGLGETIADFGAWIAGCRRLHSKMYPSALLQRDVPYAPPLPERD